MLTLTYGFQKPQTGDKGSVFFPALEADIQQINDHTHNGTNSSKLTAAASKSVTQLINFVAWASIGNGEYSQTVTMPGAMLYDDYNIVVRAGLNGAPLALTMTKASANTFLLVGNFSDTILVVYT